MREPYILCFVAESCTILCDAIAFASMRVRGYYTTGEIRSGREGTGKLECKQIDALYKKKKNSH